MALLRVRALFGPKAADGEARQARIGGGAQFEFGALLLGENLAQLRARLLGVLERLVDIDRGVSKKLTWSASSTRSLGSTLSRRARPKSEVSSWVRATIRRCFSFCNCTLARRVSMPVPTPFFCRSAA